MQNMAFSPCVARNRNVRREMMLSPLLRFCAWVFAILELRSGLAIAYSLAKSETGCAIATDLTACLASEYRARAGTESKECITTNRRSFSSGPLGSVITLTGCSATST